MEIRFNLKHLKIIKNIFTIMPDLIITHSDKDYHADHNPITVSNTMKSYTNSIL